MMRIAAAILAGGKATRMSGFPKGLLAARDGVSIVERLIGELAAAGIAEIVISANDPDPYRVFNRPVVADRHHDVGPLGGIEAVLSSVAARNECVLFVPCDLPDLTAEEILTLVQAYENAPGRVVVARTSEGDQPLCAVVPTSMLPPIASAIAAGSNGVGRLWRTLEAVEVEIAASWRFTNINTAEDLRQWQDHADEVENL